MSLNIKNLISYVLTISLSFGPILSIPISYAEGLEEGDQPFNVDRYQPQYNTVQSEIYTSGEAGVDEFTGAAVYNYEFELPVGRNEMQPSLGLSYNSQNMDNHNIAGFGWQLSEGSITRSNLKGIDQLYTLNEFHFLIPGKSQNLVQKNGNLYHGKYEEDFWRYEFVNDSWVVTDPYGNMYTFGSTVASRQDDPDDSSRIYKWMLDSIEDPHGNMIRYDYKKLYGNIYPKSIQYTGDSQSNGNREVRFYPFYNANENTSANRLDTMISYASGFRTFNPFRLSKIDVRVDNNLLRRYTFAYKKGDNGRRSLLKHIKVKGFDGFGNNLVLPPTKFNYHSSGEKGWEEVTDLGTFMPTFTSRPLYRDAGVRIMDVNGDAYPDYVQSTNPQVHSSVSAHDLECDEVMAGTVTLHGTRIEDGYGIFDTPIQEVFPELIHFSSQYTPAYTKIVDLNGDTFSDIVASCKDEIGLLHRKIYFHDRIQSWLDPIGTEEFQIPNNWHSGTYIDLNGDGLADFVHAEEAESDYTGETAVHLSSDIHFNNGGNGFQATDWTTPGALSFRDISGRHQDSGNRVVDLNADGLLDFVRQYSAGDSYPAGLYFHNGSGWSHEGITPEFDPTSGEYIATNAGFVSEVMIVEGVEIRRDNGRRLVDINGDGLMDVFGASQTDDSPTAYGILLNTGSHGWLSPNAEYTNALAPPVGFVSRNGFDMGTRFMDVNGDGLDDIVQEYSTDLNTGDVGLDRKVYLNKTKLGVDRLKTITNQYGGKVTYSYKPSTAYKNGSNLDNPKLPISVLTVSEITYDDRISNAYTDFYHYKDGHYFYDHAYRRELAGFGMVDHTDAKGNLERSFYHQSQNSIDMTALGEKEDHISKKGRMFRKEYYDSAGAKLYQSIYTWDKIDHGSERYDIQLESKLEQSFSGSEHRDRAESYEYDAFGNMTKKTQYGEVNGNSDGSFTDVPDGQLLSETLYALNTDQNMLRFPKEVLVKDENGTLLQKNHIIYDDLSLGEIQKGSVTKQIRFDLDGSDHLQTQMSHDEFGNPTQQTDPKGNITTIAYDSNKLLPTSITNALGHLSEMTYNLWGNVISTSDPNEVIREYIYDPAGRISEVKLPDPQDNMTIKTVTKRSYDFNQLPRQVNQENINPSHPAGFQKSYHYYDGFGRQIQNRQEIDEGEYIVSEEIYDTNGQPKWKAFPYFGNGFDYASDISQTGVWYSYDGLDRLITKTTPEGDTTLSYDVWKEILVNPENQITSSERDGFGRTILSRRVLDGVDIDTSYNYDRLGNLIKISDAQNNERDFGYDTFSRLISSSEWYRSGASSILSWSYTYDDNSNVLTENDPRGHVRSHIYDALNRPITKTSKICDTCEVDIQTDYTYDQGFYGVGLLSSVSRGGYAASYEYDALGRIISETTTIDEIDYETSQSFDIAGRITELMYPDQTKALYTYDAAGYLTQVQFQNTDGSIRDIATGIQYSPLAQITQIDFGNGITSTNTYDSSKLYRMTAKQTLMPALEGTDIAIQDLSYNYDKVGNIVSLGDTINNETSEFAYDDFNRLVSAEALSDGLPLYTRDYQYDSIGNILHKSDVGDYLYDLDNPQIVSSAGTTTYTYDENGNRLDDGSKNHEWNSENQLARSTISGQEYVYFYDHNGQRYKKEAVHAGSKTHYIGQHFEKDIDGENEIARRYIFAGNQRLATVSDEDLTSQMEEASETSDLAPVLTENEGGVVEEDQQLVASSSIMQSAEMVAYGAVPSGAWLNAKLNEGGGATTVNAVNSGHVGNITNPSWTGGFSSNALQFLYYAGSRVVFPYQYSTWMGQIVPEISFGSWFKHQYYSGSSPRTVIHKKDMFRMYVSNAGKPVCEVFPGGNPGNVKQVVSSQTVMLNTWYHGFCRYDGNTLAVYVNGIKRGEVSASGNLTDEYVQTVIGASDNGSTFNYPFSGLLDEIKVYTSALSDNQIYEISQEFNPNWPPPPPPPEPEPEPEPEYCPESIPPYLSGNLSWDPVFDPSDFAGYIYLLTNFEENNAQNQWSAGSEGEVFDMWVAGGNYYSYGNRMNVDSGSIGSLYKQVTPTVAVNDFPYLRFDARHYSSGNYKIQIGVETSDGERTLYGLTNIEGEEFVNHMNITDSWQTIVVNLRDALENPAAGKNIHKIYIIGENARFDIDNIMLLKEGELVDQFDDASNLQNWQTGMWGPIFTKSITYDSEIDSERLIINVPSGEIGSMKLDIPDLPANQFSTLRVKAKRENESDNGRILIAIKTTDESYTYFGWSNNGNQVYNEANIQTEWSELKLNFRDALYQPLAGKVIDEIELMVAGGMMLSFDDLKVWIHGEDAIIPVCNGGEEPPASQDPPAEEPGTDGQYLDQTLIAPFIYFHHPDHLGSATLSTDENRYLISDSRYFPYGDNRIAEGTSPNAFKYTDQEQDSEIGLYYYGARYYDPVIGRFISNDPLQRNIGQMLRLGELNGYRYVLNNPVKYVDPTGYYPVQKQISEIKKGSELTNYIHDFYDSNYNTLTEQLHEFRNDLRSKGTMNNRYVYTNLAGYVDLKHFFEAADKTSTYGYWGTIMGGYAVEEKQWFDGNSSAWSFEDLTSNTLGAYFGAYYMNNGEFESLSNALITFFEDIGVNTIEELKESGKYEKIKVGNQWWKIPEDYNDESNKRHPKRGYSHTSYDEIDSVVQKAKLKREYTE